MHVVRSSDGDAPGDLLDRFQAAVSSLQHGEMIKMDVCGYVEELRAVFSDPQATKIGALDFVCNVYDDESQLITLIPPNLVSLSVFVRGRSSLDFVGHVLQRRPKIRELFMHENVGGDVRLLRRFFSALEWSQVEVLGVHLDGSGAFADGLMAYLGTDSLRRLEVSMDYERVPCELFTALAGCRRLVDLHLVHCKIPSQVALPACTTKVRFYDCRFEEVEDWGFLANVRKLRFSLGTGVNGVALGRAIGELESLNFHFCEFAEDTICTMNMANLRHLTNRTREQENSE